MSILIVGQGVVGTVLALELFLNKIPFTVVDNFHELSSTKVSAGLIDPLSGPRWSLGWRGEQCFPLLWSKYPTYETLIHTQFLSGCPSFRFFSSKEHEQVWLNKPRPTAAPFIKYPMVNTPYTQAKYGGIEVTQCGYIDTKIFLNSSRDFLIKNNCFVSDQLNYSDLHFSNNQVKWRGHVYSKVVFCEGFNARFNPFFKHLPWEWSRGELLEAELDQELPSQLIHIGNQWVQTLNGNQIKCGSTYLTIEPETPAFVSTPEARMLLLTTLNQALDPIQLKAKNIQFQAGIRGYVFDRKPIVCSSDEYPNAWLISGMGSRGMQWAPYLTSQAISHWNLGIDLDPEICKNRFTQNK